MNDKPEINLTDLEVGLMAVFMRYKVFDDEECARLLRKLADRLVS